MNFNATTLKAGLKRLDHPDRYVKRPLNPQKDLLEKEKTS